MYSRHCTRLSFTAARSHHAFRRTYQSSSSGSDIAAPAWLIFPRRADEFVVSTLQTSFDCDLLRKGAKNHADALRDDVRSDRISRFDLPVLFRTLPEVERASQSLICG